LITVVMPDPDVVMASEVDALCLMGGAKVPAMCRGPLASSASGLGVGLVCWAGFLLLVRVGDRSGG
jgi:hypothetical protein